MARQTITTAELRRLAEQELGPRASYQSQTDYDIALLQMEIKLRKEQLEISHDELEHAREKFRDLYEHTALGYATLDAFGVIADVNHKLCEELAYKREDLIGFLFSSVVSADNVDRVQRLLHALQYGIPEEIDVELVRADATLFPVRLEIVLVDDLGWRVAVTPR